MRVVRQMIPGRADLSAMTRLALPVAVVQVGMVFMGVVDTVMVGHVSGAHLAAIALGNLYFFAASIFGMGALFALDPVVSQAFGAGDEEAIRRGIQRGWVMALAMTVVASLLLIPARPIMTLLRQPPEVIPIASEYALTQIPGMLAFYGFIVLRQSLQAIGRVAVIVWVIVTANVVNVGLNWVMIFGNLGFPELGAVGSGWATTLARWFMMGALLAISWALLGRYHRPLRSEALALRPLLGMLRIGGPIGIQFLLEFGIFGTIGVLMGVLGTIPMASHQIAINLASLTFMASVGITQASTVLVGQAVGLGDAPRARRAAGAGLLLSTALMTVTGLTFLAIPGLLASIYTDEAAVLTLAAALIPIAGVFQVVDGVQAVASGILRGIGDTVGPMVVNLLGFWLVGLPVSVFLGFRQGIGARGLWWGLAVGLATVAFFLLIRVRLRMDRDLRRLSVEEPAATPV